MATRGIWVAALLTVAAPAIVAQQVPEPAPSFKVGTEAVTVDVGVIDRQGQPVRGLETGDFTVTVAGQPRRVISAEYVEHANVQRLLTSTSEVVPVSTNENPGFGRLIMFVVDQSTLESGAARQVARSATRFFERLTVADRIRGHAPAGRTEPGIHVESHADARRAGPRRGPGDLHDGVGVRQPLRSA